MISCIAGRGRAAAVGAAALVFAGVLGTPAAQAHEAGDWIVKGGVSLVKPKSGNGSVLDGTVGLDVNNNARPSVTLTYMATHHVGVELLAAMPFRHDIRGSGLGTIGSTRHLPPTLSLQWHFLPDSRIQPYVGVGLNYTTFFSTRASGALAGQDLSLRDSWGVAGQVGVDVKLDERWMLSADVRYIDISSKVRLNGEDIGKARVDPWVFTAAVGYRF
ncbi:outer membrane beta-barrel protein [Verticiella sediminum]|uniref:Outer membrane beta-barrel protein n=1 Tax=Verticiella sediminum TaxID=1247510 RepID=A0A556A6E8_9BURK|nr:OmpW family outer membrane protein [Verticiella sediminum]TSH88447.1 outer membrane beta-barrel protein [Verticiella sediminum]